MLFGNTRPFTDRSYHAEHLSNAAHSGDTVDTGGGLHFESRVTLSLDHSCGKEHSRTRGSFLSYGPLSYLNSLNLYGTLYARGSFCVVGTHRFLDSFLRTELLVPRITQDLR